NNTINCPTVIEPTYDVNTAFFDSISNVVSQSRDSNRLKLRLN
ncbi:MAG: hypothetical protein RL660_1856, partial [Bacteroidota bacterium]